MLDVEEKSPEIRGTTIIVKSYPNPFLSSTTIAYELQHPATVQITIFNHLGKQIEVIKENTSHKACKKLFGVPETSQMAFIT